MSNEHIPIDFEFHESWWHGNCGSDFTREYYFNPDLRVEIDQRMRRYLYERYGCLGFGERDPEKRPLIDFGCVTMAALFGCEVIFSKGSSPTVKDLNLSDERIQDLQVSDIKNSYLLKDIIKQMDYLELRFGYVTGDLDWDGALNLALHIRGQRLFEDFFYDPHIVHKTLNVATQAMIEVVKYISSRTGTTSICVTPIIADINPKLNVTSNCAVTMISLEQYDRFVFKYDRFLSQQLQPFGVHHCGEDMERFLPAYTRLKADFFEIGWNSDVKKCREVLGPDVYVNARLSPVRLKNCSKKEIIEDTKKLIKQGDPLKTFSISSMGVEYGTPNENLEAVVETVEKYGRINNKTSRGINRTGPSPKFGAIYTSKCPPFTSPSKRMFKGRNHRGHCRTYRPGLSSANLFNVRDGH